MYELSREPEKSILVVKLQGMVGVDDYTQGVPELEILVNETNARGLLFDWTELTGWNKEVESIRFHARLEIRDKIERVAVVAERDWDDEIHWAQEAFNLPFRRFPPEDRQAALAWLESEI